VKKGKEDGRGGRIERKRGKRKRGYLNYRESESSGVPGSAREISIQPPAYPEIFRALDPHGISK
jgi:hypothetical protein